MSSSELLVDAFGRVQDAVRAATEGLTEEQLAYRVDDDANSIGWLIWHLTRVQDDHVADVAGTDQVWTAAGWDKKFGLELDRLATGYGHSSADVAKVRVSAKNLRAYFDAVHEQTLEFVSGLTDDDLPRIVDTAWDPPVTLGVRLVSVIEDCLQHVGQAAFIRGVLERKPIRHSSL
ncbi:MAG TPA: DUF664 domain-containing protein [Pseudonocardiaceae bacterium]